MKVPFIIRYDSPISALGLPTIAQQRVLSHLVDESEWDFHILLLLIAPLGYIGIHVTSWSFPFDTMTERLLWRVSCLIHFGFALVDFICMCVSDWDIWQEIILLVSFFIYFVTRVILIVLSFMAIAHLPADSYTTVNWLEVLPHM